MQFLAKHKLGGPVQTATPARPSPPTVLLFGTTGAGKSTLVNMLPDNPAYPKEIATTQFSAKGVTSTMKAYRKLVSGQEFEVLDSMGTGEDKHGTVPTHKAIEGMYEHVVGLKGGLHLVILVMKGGRITVMEENNYLLLRLLFGDDVPIALAITGMENEDDKDAWWGNQRKGRISVSASVGIVGIMGKRDVFKEDYEQSARDLQQLIKAESLPPGGGHIPKKKNWVPLLIDTVSNLVDANLTSLEAFQSRLLEVLLNYNIEKYDASRLAGKIRVAQRHPAVVFVGRSGVGKSTIINFLADKGGEKRPEVGTGGQTQDIQSYTTAINGRHIRVIETPGVGNWAATGIPPDKAIEKLHRAIIAEDSNLDAVVLVVSGEGEHFTIADANHYSLVSKFCGSNVPIYLIVTYSPFATSSIATLPVTEYSFRGKKGVALLPPTFRTKSYTRDTKKRLRGFILDAVKDGKKHEVLRFPLESLLGEVKTLASISSGDDFDRALFQLLNPSKTVTDVAGVQGPLNSLDQNDPQTVLEMSQAPLRGHPSLHQSVPLAVPEVAMSLQLAVTNASSPLVSVAVGNSRPSEEESEEHKDKGDGRLGLHFNSHAMPPPKPTSGSVKTGYNPVLDEPRPQSLELYLPRIVPRE